MLIRTLKRASLSTMRTMNRSIHLVSSDSSDGELIAITSDLEENEDRLLYMEQQKMMRQKFEEENPGLTYKIHVPREFLSSESYRRSHGLLSDDEEAAKAEVKRERNRRRRQNRAQRKREAEELTNAQKHSHDPIEVRNTQCRFFEPDCDNLASADAATVPFDELTLLRQNKLRQLDTYFQKVGLIRKQHPVLQSEGHYHSLKQAVRNIADPLNILISLDIEAFEFCNNKVTEIGISIYDPGHEIHSTVPHLRTIHLLPKENLKLRNKKYVGDNKDNFLCGGSIILPLDQCTTFLELLFHHYLVHKREQGFSTVFVGHDIRGDLSWLRSQIGVNVPDDILIADTQKMMASVIGRQVGLSTLLTMFEIPHGFLHNGGNDAYFTLLLAMRLADLPYRTRLGMDQPRFQQWFNEQELWIKGFQGYKKKGGNGVAPKLVGLEPSRFRSGREALEYVFLDAMSAQYR